MNRSVKYGLLVFAGNLVVFLLLILIGDKLDMNEGLFVILVIPGIILLLELILGVIFMAATTAQKDLGAGLLIGLGITLLVGLGVCGIMSNF